MSQDRLIESIVSSLPKSEKIVNHTIDLKDWRIRKLYKDTLWIQLLDEPDAHTVVKNGIVLTSNQAKGAYSLGKILMVGPDVQHAAVNDKVLFVKHVGQPAHRSFEGYKTCFVREESIMAVLDYDGSDEQMFDDIRDQILLGDK